jgi:hypothetical protein
VLWHAGSAEEEGPNFKALVEGFKALGYVDRQNIRLEHRFPNEIPERFKNMAAELVASKVDVLVSVSLRGRSRRARSSKRCRSSASLMPGRPMRAVPLPDRFKDFWRGY